MKEGGRGLGDAVLSVLNLEKEAIELWNADRLHTGKGGGGRGVFSPRASRRKLLLTLGAQ